jgi:hypothetical protein
MHITSVTCVLHAPPISYPWFNHTSFIWRSIQITKLLIMQFSPVSHPFLPVRPKHSPQHPVLKHRQPILLPLCEKPKCLLRNCIPYPSHGDRVDIRVVMNVVVKRKISNAAAWVWVTAVQ